jgi:hypothetical protein
MGVRKGRRTVSLLQQELFTTEDTVQTSEEAGHHLFREVSRFPPFGNHFKRRIVFSQFEQQDSRSHTWLASICGEVYPSRTWMGAG